ncbi:MAG: tail fiber protein [Candidatus Saccharibacteria bacterium]|nr:tail fiber protein [Moraxellaceae bacterium]
MIVSYGLDLNTNNILDANEINTTAYVCNGVNGTNGMNGTTWRNNNGVPANNLGVDGDYYLNNLTGDIYVRSTGIYTIISNIKGATGATGPSGTQTLFGTNTNLGTTATQPPDCIIGQILLSAAPQYAYGVPANGQLLPISQNNALFSLMGTTYGGDGITTFALPDLRPVAPNGLTYSICTTGIFPSHP